MLLFAAAALALIVVPGPNVIFIIARSVEQGRMAGLMSALGVNSGMLVHAFAAAFGLSAVIVASSTAFTIVKYAGAVYLIYMGIRTLRTRATPDTTPRNQHSLRRLFAQGFIVNVLNPKVALFFFAFLPQFVDPARGAPVTQVLILSAIFAGIAVISDAAYALTAGTLGTWLKHSRTYQVVQRYVAGGVYILLGVSAATASPASK